MPYSAKILLDSVSPGGKRITTFEISLPKFLLAELNTHRMLSRNAASSRAIPTDKMIDLIKNDPVIPVFWGKNRPGMQANEELSDDKNEGNYWDQGWDMNADPVKVSPKQNAISKWKYSMYRALGQARELSELGVHKQIVNRIIEPYMFAKVIVTATEWSNFFALRTAPGAQPELCHVAKMMLNLYNTSTPQRLNTGDWHMPLVEDIGDWHPKNDTIWTEGALRISAGRCARVSYLTHDGKRDFEKDIELSNRLLKDGHWSPFEHQACALDDPNERNDNFIGWKQFRNVLKNSPLM